MITLTRDAVLEKDTFRFLTPVPEMTVFDGHSVSLRVEEPLELPNEVLQLATSVYAGLSEPEIAEIEKIILNREHFFDCRHRLGL
ncbi:MAG: hypothetical protein BWK78_05705 [Thiotrichaceae bacterium IS1]|nr:MAG: hypothetical protein BWK78_05705 [Thiotrichaceae bacterium IS1]